MFDLLFYLSAILAFIAYLVLTKWIFFAQVILIKLIREFFAKSRLIDVHYSDDYTNKVQGYVSDLSHELTSNLRKLIVSHRVLLKAIMLIIGFCINIDVLVLIDAMFHSIEVSTLVLLASCVRSILQVLYRSPMPLGRVGPWFSRINRWSLRARPETFFSGHTCLAVITLVYHERAEFCLRYVSAVFLRNLTLFNAIVIISALIILRIHYIIDIYGAIVTCLLISSVLASL